MEKTRIKELTDLVIEIYTASACEGEEDRHLDTFELLDLLAEGIVCCKEFIQEEYKVQACTAAIGMERLIGVIRDRGIEDDIPSEGLGELDNLERFTKAVSDGHPLDAEEKKRVEDFIDTLEHITKIN